MIQARKQKSMDESLIPLINIVFLLLIFFLIAGQISHQQNQQVRPPNSSSEKKADHPEWMIEMDADKAVRLNGKAMELDRLGVDLAALTLATSNGVSIKVDRTLQAKDLDALLKVLRDIGVLSVTLLTKSAE